MTRNRRPRNTGKRWTNREQRLLDRLWAEGVPAEEIAKRLGRSVQSLYDQRRTRNVHSRVGEENKR